MQKSIQFTRMYLIYKKTFKTQKKRLIYRKRLVCKKAFTYKRAFN